MQRNWKNWVWLFTLATAPAAAQLVQPPTSADWTLAPGASEEMCFELDAGQAIRYAFEAAGPLDFNLHWHRGKEVFYPVKRKSIARRAGSFRAKLKEAYCLMWTNRTRAPVALRASIGTDGAPLR